MNTHSYMLFGNQIQTRSKKTTQTEPCVVPCTLLPTTYYLLPTTYYLLPTTFTFRSGVRLHRRNPNHTTRLGPFTLNLFFFSFGKPGLKVTSSPSGAHNICADWIGRRLCTSGISVARSQRLQVPVNRNYCKPHLAFCSAPLCRGDCPATAQSPAPRGQGSSLGLTP